MSSERHLREARRLTSADAHGVIAVRLVPASHDASVRDLAAALREAELRGVRAGLAAAGAYIGARLGRERTGHILEAEVAAIDPASVEVEP